MANIVTLALVVAGVIHILPLSGAFGETRLYLLYGLRIDDPNLLILMRHRAILFAILGAFLIFAAFRPHLQTLAITAGLVSALAFLWLAWSTGSYNGNIGKVVLADVIATISLLAAAGINFFR